MLEQMIHALKRNKQVCWAYGRLNYWLAQLLYYPYLIRLKGRLQNYDMLHIGCGDNKFDGWINADITPTADLIVFLQKKLPFRNDSLQLIYSEHVLEHVSYETALHFVSEASRVLGKGGIMRIAMPDLDTLVNQYQNNWREADWVNWPEFSFIETPAQMINIAFRWWGHQHLYNREELERLLTSAGFSDIKFVKLGESKNEQLANLETRPDSLLIAEVRKT